MTNDKFLTIEIFKFSLSFFLKHNQKWKWK